MNEIYELRYKIERLEREIRMMRIRVEELEAIVEKLRAHTGVRV